ncbi:hypothetical protein PVK06_014631 [Gossypium arboreum]|uniref:Uncharacterized protein n=1 Tax=Gossypium arboreum TaxID=29729 RepID=A0ABR0PV60_GOSAR|nr:hypothetical protein PVK06_014631 [Gossypium arboreum]
MDALSLSADYLILEGAECKKWKFQILFLEILCCSLDTLFCCCENCALVAPPLLAYLSCEGMLINYMSYRQISERDLLGGFQVFIVNDVLSLFHLWKVMNATAFCSPLDLSNL